METTAHAKERAKRVRMVCADFDGTFTDGMVYTDQNGIESVCCSRRDSLGIQMLKRAGIPVHVISKETNPVVAARCKKMGVEYDQAVESGEGKAEIIERIARNASLDLSEIAFIGDDINDIPALAIAGFAATVNDGHLLVKKTADYITSARGGEHAFREFCEYILLAQGKEIVF